MSDLSEFTPIPGFAFPPRDVLAQIAAHTATRGNSTMPKMRAKMQVQSVKSHGEPVTQETLSLMAVSGKDPFGPSGESEDNTFARYTPSANLSMTINNPALIGQFTQGQKFYVDFTEAE
jgi:hypothetical protein